jgi:hypothetical protein
MLREIATDLYGFEKDLRLPGGMLLPSRTTIVKTDTGLVVHSPLAIDDDTARQIEALGEVRWLVAPSCIHFLFLRAAKERWPDASVVGAPGLEKKLGGLAFEPLPSDGKVFGGALAVNVIEGVPSINEHVFFHEKTRSLVVTDLVFNVHETRSFMMQIFLRCVGAWKKTSQSRMWRFLTKDRAAAAASVRETLAWNFDRLVVSHGEVVESGAHERLEAGLHWVLAGAPKLLAAGGR